jgi:hypothetical protein
VELMEHKKDLGHVLRPKMVDILAHLKCNQIPKLATMVHAQVKNLFYWNQFTMLKFAVKVLNFLIYHNVISK